MQKKFKLDRAGWDMRALHVARAVRHTLAKYQYFVAFRMQFR